MEQRTVKSKFAFPKLEQRSSLKRLCDTKKGQGDGQEEKGGTEKSEGNREGRLEVGLPSRVSWALGAKMSVEGD